MSEFLDALTTRIHGEMNARPSSVRAEVVEVDGPTKTCKVRYPNPTGRGNVTTTATFPKMSNGIFGANVKVGQRVTINLPQGAMELPSITELRYIGDDPLSEIEQEEVGVKRTSTTPVVAQSFTPVVAQSFISGAVQSDLSISFGPTAFGFDEARNFIFGNK